MEFIKPAIRSLFPSLMPSYLSPAAESGPGTKAGVSLYNGISHMDRSDPTRVENMPGTPPMAVRIYETKNGSEGFSGIPAMQRDGTTPITSGVQLTELAQPVDPQDGSITRAPVHLTAQNIDDLVNTAIQLNLHEPAHVTPLLTGNTANHVSVSYGADRKTWLRALAHAANGLGQPGSPDALFEWLEWATTTSKGAKPFTNALRALHYPKSIATLILGEPNLKEEAAAFSTRHLPDDDIEALVTEAIRLKMEGPFPIATLRTNADIAKLVAANYQQNPAAWLRASAHAANRSGRPDSPKLMRQWLAWAIKESSGAKVFTDALTTLNQSAANMKVELEQPEIAGNLLSNTLRHLPDERIETLVAEAERLELEMPFPIAKLRTNADIAMLVATDYARKPTEWLRASAHAANRSGSPAQPGLMRQWLAWAIKESNGAQAFIDALAELNRRASNYEI